jgi:putative membrane protein
MRRFLTDESKTAFTDAVKAIELRSCVEVVVAIRRRSASYVHANFIVGILAAIGTLYFVLYSDYEFGLASILLDPILAGIVVGALSIAFQPLRRWLTPSSMVNRIVRHSAEATFFEKGVRHTRDRIGILVYVSLLERRVEVVADTGVVEAVPKRKWDQAVAKIQAAVSTGRGEAVAQAMNAIGDVCEPVLERSDDDINELPDEVCA